MNLVAKNRSVLVHALARSLLAQMPAKAIFGLHALMPRPSGVRVNELSGCEHEVCVTKETTFAMFYEMVKKGVDCKPGVKIEIHDQEGNEWDQARFDNEMKQMTSCSEEEFEAFWKGLELNVTLYIYHIYAILAEIAKRDKPHATKEEVDLIKSSISSKPLDQPLCNSFQTIIDSYFEWGYILIIENVRFVEQEDITFTAIFKKRRKYATPEQGLLTSHHFPSQLHIHTMRSITVR